MCWGEGIQDMCHSQLLWMSEGSIKDQFFLPPCGAWRWNWVNRLDSLYSLAISSAQVFCFCGFCCFKKRVSVSQAGLELTSIHLLQPPIHWGYRAESPHPTQFTLERKESLYFKPKLSYHWHKSNSIAACRKNINNA